MNSESRTALTARVAEAMRIKRAELIAQPLDRVWRDLAETAIGKSAAPDMLAALILVRSIIVEAAMTGFNCHDGDWAERLFASQQVTHDAVVKAAGREAGRTMTEQASAKSESVS